jgi:hypothetical protein
VSCGNTISDVFGDLTNSITKPLAALTAQFGEGGIAGLVGQVPGALLGVMWDTVKDTVSAAFDAIVNPPIGTTDLPSAPSSAARPPSPG